MPFLEAGKIQWLFPLVLLLSVLTVHPPAVEFVAGNFSPAQTTPMNENTGTTNVTVTVTATAVSTQFQTVTTTVYVTNTTTSISTSPTYVPVLVSVTITTTLSTFTSTLESIRTMNQSVTLTSTMLEIAPIWNSITPDSTGLTVLLIGVALGMVAVALHRRLPWVAPIGITTIYVAVSFGGFQVGVTRIQYMLGYVFVLLGAAIQGARKENNTNIPQ
jgi:hypothetical protein